MLALMKTGKRSGVVRTQEFCLPYLVLMGEHLYFLLYYTSTSCTIQLRTFERTHIYTKRSLCWYILLFQEHYYSLCDDPKLRAASVAPTSQVRSSAV
jgi:hypothetical protein